VPQSGGAAAAEDRAHRVGVGAGGVVDEAGRVIRIEIAALAVDRPGLTNASVVRRS